MLNKLSLNTIGLNRIGLNRIGRPSVGSSGSRPYIDPEVLASLVGVWECDGKTNYDPGRNIIKNKIKNAGGDFEILNAAYEGMSGFDGYPVVFGANKTWELFPTYNYKYDFISSNKLHVVKILNAGTGLLFHYVRKDDGELINIKKIPSFQIKVEGLEGESELMYRYISTVDASRVTVLRLSNGIHKLPESFAPTDIIANNSWVGFTITPISSGVNSFDCDISIEVLPVYEGAFVADGVNDMIVSQKPVQEMLGGSTECTVISMMVNLEEAKDSIVNVLGKRYLRNIVASRTSNKYGIFGYTSTNIDTIGTINVVNNLLGDKNDYTASYPNSSNIKDIFSVNGFIDGSNPVNLNKKACYWTIIAKKVLTTDQINQVIAYFNLDKHVEPIVYYDVSKQGLTNDTPLADWYLKDYSKNGWNMALFNFLRKLNSGVGLYQEDFTAWSSQGATALDSYANKVIVTSTDTRLSNNYIIWSGNVTHPIFNIKVSGLKDIGLEYKYFADGKVNSMPISTNGIYKLPASDINGSQGFIVRDGKDPNIIGLTIEQIPDFENGLVFDGVNDYGQLVQALGLKDYTVVADRAYNGILKNQVPIIGSGDVTQSPFILEFTTSADGNPIMPFSYGLSTTLNTSLIASRKVIYQSAYAYEGNTITKGSNNNEGSGLTFGKFGEADTQYAKLVLWRFLLFKYSMSEFLIERQLKKFKAGTLYPDMIQWRPIVKSNADYEYVRFYIGGALAVNGQYYTSQIVSVQVKPNGINVPSVKINGIPLKLGDIYNGIYRFVYTLDKSPQKVDITIAEENANRLSNENN